MAPPRFSSGPTANTNPTAFVLAPNGWDACWRPAKAASPTTPAWVYFCGDSYMQGGVSSDWINKSFRGLVRAFLLQTYSLYADFWPTHYSADFATVNTSTFNGTPPWVVNSTTSKGYLAWWGVRPINYSAANAATLCTFTTPYACTALDILHAPSGNGSFQYSVDGGALQTVNVTNITTVQKIALTGLANTTHTVAFSNVSAANCMILLGITTYATAIVGGVPVAATSGIGFAHAAYSGGSAQGMVSASQQPQPQSLWLAGNEKQSSPVGNFGFPTQPHLAIIGLGLNDCTNQVGLQQYEYALSDVCEGFRAGRANCSLLLVGHSSPDGVHSDVTSGLLSATQNKMYKHYLAAQQRVAERYGAAWVNVHAKWGNKGAALGFQTTGQQHPTDQGHADIATLIQGVI